MNQMSSRGKFVVLLAAVLASTMAYSAVAQDDEQRQEEAAEIKYPAQPEIPERNLEFVESNEPYPIELFAADPNLLKQSYMATVRFEIPPQSEESVSNLPRELREFVSTLVYARVYAANPIPVEQLVKRFPTGRRADQQLVTSLSDPLNVRLSREAQSLVFLILGPDVENVRAKSLALIELYDYGLSYPIQQALISEMQRLDKELTESNSALERGEAQIAALQANIQQYEPITAETIADLQTPKRLLTVDIAGAKARIAACEKFLGEQARDKRLVEQVETIKIAAEVEMAGLTARKAAIDEIIQQGDNYHTLQDQLLQQRQLVVGHKSRIQVNRRRIQRWEELRQRFLPFALAEPKITIRPIAWKPAESNANRLLGR